LREHFADRLLVASGADSIEASQTSLQAAEAVSVELVQRDGGQLVLPARKFVEAVNFNTAAQGPRELGGAEREGHWRRRRGGDRGLAIIATSRPDICGRPGRPLRASLPS